MKSVFPLIDIETFKKVSSIFAGNYKTSFRGSGIEFADIQEYALWDDAMRIDWKTTARTGKVHTIEYEEEREQKVLFVLDVGQSMLFGSSLKTKRDTLTEVFSLLSFSSLENSDPIGAYFFSDRIVKYFSTKKGASHLQQTMKALLSFDFSLQSQSFLGLITHELFRKKTKNHIVFILSDSLEFPDEHELRSLADQNDCIFVHISDSFENTLNQSWIYAFGSKSGLFIDVNDQEKKERYVAKRKQQLESFEHRILSLGASYISLDESSHIYKEIYGFFQSRKNRGL